MRRNALIVPVSGIYQFTLKGYKSVAKQSVEISLRVNEKAMANSYAGWISNHDYHSQFSMNTILKLKKSDVVDLYLTKGHIYEDEDNQNTTFTGKLLSIDQSENSLN